jgi:hypothetical protein
MEEYKNIKGYENYQISNFGNVKNIKTNRILKQSLTTTGYKEVKINGKHFKIHRLIGEYFIDNPNNLLCIDHIDNDKTNNNINNLRWCSYSDNCKNKTKKINCSTNYTGISKYRTGYEAYVWNNYKKHRIGYFKDIQEAYNKRKEYIENIGNEFYKL